MPNWSNLEIASRRLADLQETESYWAARHGRQMISYQGQQQLVERRKDIERDIMDSVCAVMIDFVKHI